MDADRRNRRRSIRLRDFDYSRGGVYFLTLCTDRRRCILGRIVDGEAQLNRLGRIVEDAWLASLQLRPYLNLDAYVIMPNHLHGVVVIDDHPEAEVAGAPEGARSAPLRHALRNGMHRRSLAAFVAGFKSTVTRQASAAFPKLQLPLWQRNYYEHIVRDDRDLERIRRYIASNPAQWEDDGYNPRFFRQEGASHPLRRLR